MLRGGIWSMALRAHMKDGQVMGLCVVMGTGHSGMMGSVTRGTRREV